MECLDHIQTLERLCKLSNKFGIYFNCSQADETLPLTEVIKAAPFLGNVDYGQSLVDGSGYLLFDSFLEMTKCYHTIIGNDGPDVFPKMTNTYNGPARVYAITCDNTGQWMNENT